MRKLTCKCGYGGISPDFNYCPVCRRSLKNMSMFKTCRNEKCGLLLYRDDVNCPECETMQIDKLQKGDEIMFGSYFQATSDIQTKETLSWIIAELIDGEALLISKKILDFRQFNDSMESADWDECSLKRHLCGEFMEEAFSPEERLRLIDKGAGKVFCPSCKEAEMLGDPEKRKAEGTDYAKQKDKENFQPFWLTRDRFGKKYVFFIDDDGIISKTKTLWTYIGTRPAVWIKL